jgi:hypothetical protein
MLNSSSSSKAATRSRSREVRRWRQTVAALTGPVEHPLERVHRIGLYNVVWKTIPRLRCPNDEEIFALLTVNHLKLQPSELGKIDTYEWKAAAIFYNLFNLSWSYFFPERQTWHYDIINDKNVAPQNSPPQRFFTTTFLASTKFKVPQP